MTKKYSVYSVIIMLIIPLSSLTQNMNYLDRELPSQWSNDTLFNIEYKIDTNWWTSFDDMLLDSLIRIAISNNYSLKSAEASLNKAYYNYKESENEYFPNISLDMGYYNSGSSLNMYDNTIENPNRYTDYMQVSMSSKWAIDIFGSVRNNVKAMKKEYMSVEANYYNTILNICAEVGMAYFNLRSYQQQYDLLKETIASSKAILNITLARYNTGLGSQLDVSQAKSVYYSSTAALPEIQSYITRYINNIALLIGVYPSDIAPMLENHRPLPNVVRIIDAGIPANSIRRRMDVRQAELAIEANSAALGATKADYYPKLYLSGSFGLLSHNIENLADANSMTYQFTPTLTWNIFSGFQVRNATRKAKMTLTESIEEYNETILNAVQEVESIMNIYANAIQAIQEYQHVVNEGIKTLNLSVDIYKQGLGTFTNVLDAQRSLLSYQNNLISAQNSALISLVRLYQALGGGW